MTRLLILLLLLFLGVGESLAEKRFDGYRRTGERLPPPVFSPDGSLLAIANYYEIHLRRLPSYELAQTIPMPHGRIGGLAFTPDNSLMVGDVNGALAVFNPGQAAPKSLHALQVPINALAVSPDGRSIAVSGDMGQASRTIVLDSVTLKPRFDIPGSKAWQLLFLDDDLLLTLEDTATSSMRLISLKQQRLLRSKMVPDGILGASCNRSEGLLYVGSVPRLRLLEAATLRDITQFQDAVRSNPISAVAWHDRSRLLVTAEAEGPLSVRDPANGAILHRLYGNLNRPEQLVISPDGSSIVSITGAGELVVWNSADFKPLIKASMQLPSEVRALSAVPAGRTAGMHIGWKRGSTQATLRLPGQKKNLKFEQAVDNIEAWGGDARQFCIAGTASRNLNKRTEMVELRDSVTLELLMKKSFAHGYPGAHGEKLLAMFCRDRETAMLLSSGSLTVFRGGDLPPVVIPRRGDGNNQFTTMAISPNSAYLALAERLGVIRVLRTADYSLVQELFTDWSLPGPVSVSISDQGEVEATVADGTRYRWSIRQKGEGGVR